MKCPRCNSDKVIKHKGLVTCAICNPQEYWKLHQENNPDRVGDWF